LRQERDVKMPEFSLLADAVRNWGRWGESDQRGTLNHITPEVLRKAAACVTEGRLFHLGLRFDRNGPQLNQGRFNPKLFASDLFTPLSAAHPTMCFSDDVVTMPLQCATQWDGLAHVHYDDRLYNGHRASESLGVHCTLCNGVEGLAESGIMSRGVLLDIARLKGLDRLGAEYPITPDDLNAACKAFGVQVEPGDAVLIRTGHLQVFLLDGDRDALHASEPGLTAECAEWLFDRSASAVAADTVGVEVVSRGGFAEDIPFPFHLLALRDMGCPLGELFNLEALAEDCSRDGRYAFLFSAPPLAITGAFGSPVNPLVLK
jgi:kynurenine formamidase